MSLPYAQADWGEILWILVRVRPGIGVLPNWHQAITFVTNQPSVSDWVVQVPLWPSGLGFGLWSERPGFDPRTVRSTFTSVTLPPASWRASQEWGLLSRFPPFRYAPNFATSPKYMWAIEYHVHIWQVSPQLRCGDTCKLWLKFKERNKYFCDIENFAYREIDERSFSCPHPRSVSDALCCRRKY